MEITAEMWNRANHQAELERLERLKRFSLYERLQEMENRTRFLAELRQSKQINTAQQQTKY